MKNTAHNEASRDFGEVPEMVSFCWSGNSEVRKLLDVVVAILADEYIRIARENPDAFEDRGGEE